MARKSRKFKIYGINERDKRTNTGVIPPTGGYYYVTSNNSYYVTSDDKYYVTND